MTREEFESILEEVFEEGYNQAIDDLEQEIANEETYDLTDFEDDYDYYDEGIDVRNRMRKILNNVPGKTAVHGLSGKVARTGSNFQKGLRSYKSRVVSGVKNKGKEFDRNKQLIKNKFNRLLAKRSI